MNAINLFFGSSKEWRTFSGLFTPISASPISSNKNTIIFSLTSVPSILFFSSSAFLSAFSSAFLKTFSILSDVVIWDPLKLTYSTLGALMSEFKYSMIIWLDIVFEVPGFPQIISGILESIATFIAYRFSQRALLTATSFGILFAALIFSISFSHMTLNLRMNQNWLSPPQSVINSCLKSAFTPPINSLSSSTLDLSLSILIK